MYTTSLKTWARAVAVDGIKTPDDIEEEFAKHRAHVRQTNDVVDDKITK